MTTIATVVENTVLPGNPGVKGEHGLSFLIETDTHSVLFDTGQSALLMRNAASLGLNMKRISVIALSHGHYDHTGGFRAVAQSLAGFSVAAHPGLFNKRYIRQMGLPLSIGSRFDLASVAEMGGSFLPVTTPAEIAPGIRTTGEIPLTTDFESLNTAFFRKAADSPSETDAFEDEQALIVHTPSGPVVLIGCAHRGVGNTLHQAARVAGTRTLYGVFGGLHLDGAGDGHLNRVIDIFKQYDVQRIGVGHCTGKKSVRAISEALKDRLIPFGVGCRIQL